MMRIIGTTGRKGGEHPQHQPERELVRSSNCDASNNSRTAGIWYCKRRMKAGQGVELELEIRKKEKKKTQESGEAAFWHS